MKLKNASLKRFKKLINLQFELIKKREHKSTKSEMKKKLQTPPQKYETSEEITMENYMPIQWTTQKKVTNSQKCTICQD